MPYFSRKILRSSVARSNSSSIIFITKIRWKTVPRPYSFPLSGRYQEVRAMREMELKEWKMDVQCLSTLCSCEISPKSSPQMLILCLCQSALPGPSPQAAERSTLQRTPWQEIAGFGGSLTTNRSRNRRLPFYECRNEFQPPSPSDRQTLE